MFPIPDQKLNTEENDIYTKFAEGKIDAKECVKAIKELNELTVEIDADKITSSLNDLEKANLSIAELSQISSFIHN